MLKKSLAQAPRAAGVGSNTALALPFKKSTIFGKNIKRIFSLILV
jgi:hypothetical protein